MENNDPATNKQPQSSETSSSSNFDPESSSSFSPASPASPASPSNFDREYLNETDRYESDFDDSLIDDEFGTVNDQNLEITLISWLAPSHIQRQATRRYYFNLALIVIIIALILIFVQQFYLLMMVLAIVFLLVVTTISTPQPIRHTITNYGIYSGGHFYPWENRGKNFWFEKDDSGHRILYVQTRQFPWSIVMILNQKISEERLTQILNNFLTHQQPKRTWMDKVIAWFKRTFPLDW